MVKRKVFSFVSVLLIGLLVLSGCDMTSILSKDKEPPLNGETSDNENNASESSDMIEVSFAEPIKLDNHITVTVNDAKIFSSFEETEYSEDEECVVKKDFNNDCVFLLLDYTFLYTDENLKGQLIKGNDKLSGINSMFELYSSKTGEQSGTWGDTWDRFPDTEVVFDYTVVDGGENYIDSSTQYLYFDLIEGQELNLKVLYAVPEERANLPFYLLISKILVSDEQKYYVNLNLFKEGS